MMTFQANNALKYDDQQRWDESADGAATDRPHADTPSRGIAADNEDRTAVQAFRELRTELLRRTEGQPFSLTVTGAIKGSGTSYVAINLAAAIARDRRRSAYLIDCNTMNPSLQKRFGLPDGPGLTDYLLAPETHGLREVAYPTQRPRLFVIPIGTALAEDPECLTSPAIPQLLKTIRQRDENAHVIIDSASLDRSADARMLADECHMASVVVPYGKLMTAQLEDAVRAFTAEQFAGVVFNRLPLVRGR